MKKNIKNKIISVFKKQINVLLLIFISIFFTSCAIGISNLNKINAISLNKNWTLKIHYYDSIKIYLYNDELFDIKIYIGGMNAKKEEINLFLPVLIPYKTTYNNENNCATYPFIGFYTQNIKNGKVINFLKTNTITFDTNKVFIIKNDKKYKIDGGKNNTMLNISEILLNNFDKEKFKDRNVNYARSFSSPIGCQALEGTTLVIGGIYLNGEELPPIKIKLSYKKDKE